MLCSSLFTHLSATLPDHWSRRIGSLRPTQVLYSLIRISTNENKGYKRVLNDLTVESSSLLGWDRAPCTSSLSEARRKLSVEKCREAFLHMRHQCATYNRVHYYDFRLVAGDMTKLALPAYASVRKEFGSPKDSKGRTAKAPQATLTALWDVSTNTPIDWRLERCYASERFAAHDMLDQLNEKDLLILDRGYPSRRMFMDLDTRKIKYLIRVSSGKAGAFKEVRAFSEDTSAWDRIVMLHENNKRQGEPTITIRLMKKRLACGKIAVFATNLLSSRTYSRRSLCDLYCYRWDIETAFREMKIWHGLENFTARYADGIHQEVCALMMYMLLVGELEGQAYAYHKVKMKNINDKNVSKASKPTEPEVRWNRQYICDHIEYLLKSAAQGMKYVSQMFHHAMRELWRYRQKVYPGRTFERQAKSPNAKYKKTTYNTKANGGP